MSHSKVNIILVIIMILSSIAQVTTFIILSTYLFNNEEQDDLDWKNVEFKKLYLIITILGLLVNIFCLLLITFMTYKFYFNQFSVTFQNCIIIKVVLFICLVGCTLKSLSIQNMSAVDLTTTNNNEICGNITSSDYQPYLSIFDNFELVTNTFNELLCSSECPCKVDKSSSLNITNIVIGGNARNILDCGNDLISKRLNDIISLKLNIGYIDKIEFYDIVNYMSLVEERHKCSGFCPVNNNIYNKYLFSDINNGNPINNGCFQFINSYFPDYVQKYTNLSLLSNLLFFVTIIILSIIIYIDLNLQVKLRQSKDKENQHTETQYSADIFNYQNAGNDIQTTNLTNIDQNQVQIDDEKSSSESDEIEFDTDDDESEDNKSKDIEMSEILE